MICPTVPSTEQSLVAVVSKSTQFKFSIKYYNLEERSTMNYIITIDRNTDKYGLLYGVAYGATKTSEGVFSVASEDGREVSVYETDATILDPFTKIGDKVYIHDGLSEAEMYVLARGEYSSAVTLSPECVMSYGLPGVSEDDATSHIFVAATCGNCTDIFKLKKVESSFSVESNYTIVNGI